jgi:hypothetical protein
MSRSLAQGNPSPIRVLLDGGHNEEPDAGLADWKALLGTRGYQIDVHRSAITDSALRGVNILVIANPFPEPRPVLVRKAAQEGRLLRWSTAANKSAFTDGEVQTVKRWIDAGGSLLLILNHAPHGATVGALAAAIGIPTRSVETTDSTHLDPPRTPIPLILYTRQAGSFGSHVITAGVDSVVSYGGGSFAVPEGVCSLLRVPPNRVDREFIESTGTFQITPSRGRSQAAALHVGTGRVVLLGQAAMVRSDPAVEQAELSGGIGNPHLGNRQFVMNVIDWLARGDAAFPNRKTSLDTARACR